MRITANSVDLVLARSKTSVAGTVEEVTIPRAPVALAVQAIERWIERAGIGAGEPLLRRVSKGGVIGSRIAADGSEDDGGGRLTPQSVSLILQSRIAERLKQQASLPTKPQPRHVDSRATACALASVSPPQRRKHPVSRLATAFDPIAPVGNPLTDRSC